MNVKMNQWQHASVSLALLILCLVVVYFALVAPAIKGRMDINNRLENLQFQHTKFAGSAQRIDEIKQELDQLRHMQHDVTGFLEEKPQALAAADLQKYIKDLVESNGGNLVSMQVVNKKDNGKLFPEVTIKTHMRVDMESLKSILYNLAANRPVLLINDLAIQSRNQSTRRRTRRGQGLLETRFEITGYIYQSDTA